MKSENQRYSMVRKTQSPIAGFKNGERGHKPRNAGSRWKHEKARSGFFLEESRKAQSSADI